MSEVVIRAEGLGKSYLIGHQVTREPYVALRDVLAGAAKRLTRTVSDAVRGGAHVAAGATEEFWALKDVSFEIARGDIVGVIGRNGAGKSTLLKILSRITEPTEGEVRIKGRIASLLEVGTGFHPELTGRENIYLNGAILGMSRAEIKRKFDEIVAFAEVEKFLDTPVKRYSSGMYVRLAFAVAAHLEPEILIVDEVLAVGDAEFQKKCLGKMQDVAGHGRTVLFVSHNMQTVVKLCGKVMTLTNGRADVLSNDVEAEVRKFLGTDLTLVTNWEGVAPLNSPWFQANLIEAFQEGSAARSEVNHEAFTNALPITIRVTGFIPQSNPALTFGIAVFSDTGDMLFWSCTTDSQREDWPKIGVGSFDVSVDIPSRFLNAGTYRVDILASLHYQMWLLEPGKTTASIAFSIAGGLSDSPIWHERRPGCIAPVLRWCNFPVLAAAPDQTSSGTTDTANRSALLSGPAGDRF